MKNKPIGIQLHEKQIKAINNGASAFIMPIYIDIRKSKYGYSHLNNKLKTSQLNSNYYQSIETLLEHLIKHDCHLQIGQKFYVQEVFTIDNNMNNSISYQSDFQDEGTFEDWCEYSASTYYEAKRMTYKQSKLKDFTTSTIEVKRVQDLTHYQVYNMDSSISTPYVRRDWNNVKEWIDSIYGKGTYESNPYVFIVKIERKL